MWKFNSPQTNYPKGLNMDISTFITTIYCITSDWFDNRKLRKRGPDPVVSDPEILTMEIVGEFLGLDEDKKIYLYFKRHWSDAFPLINQVHRTTFSRQASNLWAVKHQLWQYLLTQVETDSSLSIVDSMPIHVCRFARANRCRLFHQKAAYGYDSLERQTFYGFRLHARIEWPGVITAIEASPANVHDLDMLDELKGESSGIWLADRNYWSPEEALRHANDNIALIAPYKSKKKEKLRWPLWLVQKRRRIETVFGQLVGRFKIKTVWARDMWHLSSRIWRKVVSHTFSVLIAQQLNIESPLQFDKILTD